MTRNRPAPNRSRPEPPHDATNVPVIVDQGELFGASRGAYGGVEFTEPAPVPDGTPVKNLTPDPVKIAHTRMANTVGGEQWLKMAERWIDERLEAGRTVDADGLQAQVGTPPTAGLPAVAIKRAKLAGKITRVGFAASERPAARGHVVAIWGPR